MEIPDKRLSVGFNHIIPKSSVVKLRRKTSLNCYKFHPVNSTWNIIVLYSEKHNKQTTVRAIAAINAKPGGKHSNRCAINCKQGTHILLRVNAHTRNSIENSEDP